MFKYLTAYCVGFLFSSTFGDVAEFNKRRVNEVFGHLKNFGFGMKEGSFEECVVNMHNSVFRISLVPNFVILTKRFVSRIW